MSRTGDHDMAGGLDQYKKETECASKINIQVEKTPDGFTVFTPGATPGFGSLVCFQHLDAAVAWLVDGVRRHFSE